MDDYSVSIKLFENNWITEDQKWEVRRISHKGECKTYTVVDMDPQDMVDTYRRHGYAVPADFVHTVMLTKLVLSNE